MIVGTGIDVVEIARIERALDRRGERFERRVFTAGEIASCRRFGRAAPHFAVRFAAKEAVMKAVGTGFGEGVRFVDIETRPRGSRASDLLDLHLHGRVAELAGAGGGGPLRTHLSVSRSRSHALAVVVLECTGP